MKILIPILIIFIIIFFIIIIFNSNIYFGENFTNKNEEDTIDKPIALSYVPSNPYLKENLSEYDITNTSFARNINSQSVVNFSF